MNKETVKEGALRIIPDKSTFGATERSGFIKGAKWQAKKSYNEEDMIDFAMFYYAHQGKDTKYWGKDLFKQWFEQFKKK